MADEDLTVVVARIEAQLKALAQQVEMGHKALSEKVDYGERAAGQLVRLVEERWSGKLDRLEDRMGRLESRFGDWESARSSDHTEAEKKEAGYDERLRAAETWIANINGRMAVGGLIVGVIASGVGSLVSVIVH